MSDTKKPKKSGPGHRSKAGNPRRQDKTTTKVEVSMSIDPADLAGAKDHSRYNPVDGSSIRDMYDHDKSSDELLESRIKAGHAGIELIDWVMNEYQCSEPAAISEVHRVIKRSAAAIKNSFNEDQILLMAFNLYRRSLDAGKVRDAAQILQNIMVSIGEASASSERNQVSVKVLEYLPENK